MVLSLAAAAVAVAALYFVLPRVAGLDETWERIQDGDPWWLALALAFEALSYGGYVALFRAVVAGGGVRMDWLASYRITMAGVAATRLLATAGAGGIALSAWALRRLGMAGREVAVRLAAFLVLLYAVFMAALVLCGAGLRSDLLPGPAPAGVTVVPAAFGALVIALALALALVPRDLGARATDRWGDHRGGRLARWAGTAPALLGDGVRMALGIARRRDPRILGAVAWWGFDIAVLWAAFEAFGDAPQAAVLVMSYFTGMLANTLPLPGGIGGVEGGMIGTLLAFGVPAGLAIVAVLTYRAYAFWLPTLPGIAAFVGLRRSLRENTDVARRPGSL